MFNFVTYEEIGLIVEAVIQKRLGGIFNVASSEPIGIEEIVSISACAGIAYGPVEYRAPRVSIDRAAELAPTLRLPSRVKLLDMKAEIDGQLRSSSV